jgi:hypothetical protein
VVALIYNNIPLSYAQDNSTMNNTPMTNLTQTEEEEEYATTEAGPSAEEEEEEHNETSIVRDSVTELLQDKIIPGGDFIHLYDSTPYNILNGHVALKFLVKMMYYSNSNLDWFCSKHDSSNS